MPSRRRFLSGVAAGAVAPAARNQTGVDTIVRGTEGTLSFRDGGFQIDPEPGSQKNRAAISLVTQERDHMRNFVRCMQERKTPNCDIELPYRVQTPLIISMMSFVEGKVAWFDAATATIRMG